MMIRTQQLLSAGISAGVVLFLGVTMVDMTRTVDAATREVALSREIVAGVADLRFLASEYMLFHDDRPKLQWPARNAEVRKLLAGERYEAPAARAAIRRMRASHEDVAALFSRLIAVDAGGDAGPGRETELRLVGQLRAISHHMIGEALRLMASSQDALVQAQNRHDAISAAFVMVIALLVLGNAYLSFRTVLHPIARLRAAVEALDGGDLGRRTGVVGRHEIGELAAAFDRMADGLQAKTAELTEANRELEAFAYSVSHDLRTPLRAIDGFSQVLLEDYAGKLDDEGQDSLRRIRAASQRLGVLIDDILRLSRAGRAALAPVEVDLSALAESIVADHRRADPQREVRVSIAPDITVQGDPGLLRQVLANLVDNAWKFTARRRDARIDFAAERKGGEVVCRIADNGAGFDPQYAERLWGPFQRLHSEQEFPGTGIGLATVKRIVSRHGGRVWAEGSVDQGARFSFALPLHPAKGST